jgi:hypothetical protein
LLIMNIAGCSISAPIRLSNINWQKFLFQPAILAQQNTLHSADFPPQADSPSPRLRTGGATHYEGFVANRWVLPCIRNEYVAYW